MVGRTQEARAGDEGARKRGMKERGKRGKRWRGGGRGEAQDMWTARGGNTEHGALVRENSNVGVAIGVAL